MNAKISIRRLDAALDRDGGTRRRANGWHKADHCAPLPDGLTGQESILLA